LLDSWTTRDASHCTSEAARFTYLFRSGMQIEVFP
jgi:hypothetical protein